MKKLIGWSLLVLGYMAASTAFAQDFQRVKSESGEVLLAQHDGKSAKAALKKAIKALGSPKVLNSMVDAKDTEAHAFVAGGRLVVVTGSRIIVLSGSSIRKLTELAKSSVPKDELKWHNARLPDGSGQLRLPEGWRIAGAHQGMVSAEGPHGTVDLGIWAQIYTPQAAAQCWVKPPLVGQYKDPETALREITPQVSALLEQQGQPGLKFLRVIERAPVEWGFGKSEFLHIELERGGQKWQSVCLIIMNMNVDGTWLYYTSGVGAPSDKFAKSLPVLAQIWGSWKVADHVYRQRLNKALESMAQTSQIITDTHENYSKTMDRAMRNWSYGFRGDAPVRDEKHGTDHDLRRYENGVDLEKVIENANRAEGYERYRTLDPKELD
jgi:hypothetical protein